MTDEQQAAASPAEQDASPESRLGTEPTSTDDGSAARSAEPQGQQPSDDLSARLAQLEKENRALQSKIDRETAAERRERLRAERELEQMREYVIGLEAQHKTLREKSIDTMDEQELREYIRSHFQQTDGERTKRAEGERLYREADEAVRQLNVSDEEYVEFFDQRLNSLDNWVRNPNGALVLLREGIAAVKAARKREAVLKKDMESKVKEQVADIEHAERDRRAQAGAFTPDRSKGSPPVPMPRTPAEWARLSWEDYERLRPQILGTKRR